MTPPTRFTTGRGLASRLLAGQTIVLIAGALTTGLVAALLGPSIFHQHLLEAGHAENSPELVHIEMAYRDASFLAHELRTPITTLTAYHDGLHDGVVALGPGSQAALTEQTDRLARLAEDIDEVSTAEEGRLSLLPEAVAVSDLLWNAGEAVRDRYHDAGVNLAVDTTSAAGLTVDIDRQRLGQVLSNLLTNALRHTPAGGIVTVSARQVDDEIDITVTDTGEGITPDHLPHVFERFYRGDAARSRGHSGSGIGLTISKAIVDAHHGTIRALSQGPGQGATFVVTLPRRQT